MSKATLSGKFGTANPAADPFLDARSKLIEAESLRLAEKFEQSQKICEQLLDKSPDYVGALQTLGLVHADRGDFSRAFSCLSKAVMLNPKDWKILTALSGVYLQLGAREMAALTLEQARLLRPQEASIAHTLGEIYRDDREYELAQNAFRTALELDSRLTAAAMGLGWCSSHLGQFPEAAARFEFLVKHNLHSNRTLYALSQLPSTFVSVDLMGLLERADKGTGGANLVDAQLLAASRAAALDKAGDHAKAWAQMKLAKRDKNRRIKEGYAFEQRRQAASLARVNADVDQDNTANAESHGQPLSLFILGPSRSGKTSLERLASSLRGVKRGYENPIVENAVRRTFQTEGLPTSSQFAFLPLNLDNMCRDFYYNDLARRAGNASVFTNTHPERIHDVMRMARAIPGVRLIFVKRDLNDVVLRIYMKQYARGNFYAHDLTSIREYVCWYYEMEDLLVKHLPEISRVIYYEQMVTDPTASLRTIAELCGLAMPEIMPSHLGDDRGCANPYLAYLNEAFN